MEQFNFRYKPVNAQIIFEVFDQLEDGEYCGFGFSWYLRHDGAVYQVKGNETNVFSQRAWTKVYSYPQ